MDFFLSLYHNIIIILFISVTQHKMYDNNTIQNNTIKYYQGIMNR